MPKGIVDLFWKDEKNVELFRKLCKKSEDRPMIRWKKFRKFDKKGVFAEVTNTQLASTYRKFWLLDQGICPKCGKYYLEDEQSVCSVCVENNKKHIINFLKRKREKDVE